MDEHRHVDAARRVFDASAGEYVGFVGTELSAATEDAVDLAMLTAFVELVKASGVPGQVADVGTGPGRAAAFLARRGLDVVGVDVSPALLAFARVAHPHIRFDDGALDDLPFGAGALAGVVCWYSIIFTPPELLVDAFVEIGRVLAPSGLVLLAFQSGAGETVDRPDAHGTGVTLTSHWHDVDEVAEHLEAAGFDVHSRTVRAPLLPHERTTQAVVIARRRRPS